MRPLRWLFLVGPCRLYLFGEASGGSLVTTFEERPYAGVKVVVTAEDADPVPGHHGADRSAPAKRGTVADPGSYSWRCAGQIVPRSGPGSSTGRWASRVSRFLSAAPGSTAPRAAANRRPSSMPRRLHPEPTRADLPLVPGVPAADRCSRTDGMLRAGHGDRSRAHLRLVRSPGVRHQRRCPGRSLASSAVARRCRSVFVDEHMNGHTWIPQADGLQKSTVAGGMPCVVGDLRGGAGQLEMPRRAREGLDLRAPAVCW